MDADAGEHLVGCFAVISALTYSFLSYAGERYHVILEPANGDLRG